ncbi:hypothetical protein JMJ35_006617 [Cladonia borealis]|uniref:Uncharacterized protein n=1 Tax=Cladonia borealis TaxID=184061 RepID=A0AA39V7V7_9LECA|nr:hypothetical protein JMJ35_006617 [Cladonia borealis]
MSYLQIRFIIGLLYQGVRFLAIIGLLYQGVRFLAIIPYVILFFPDLLYRAITLPSNFSLTYPFAVSISNIANPEEHILIPETSSSSNDEPLDSQINTVITSSTAPCAPTSLEHPIESDEIDNAALKEERGWLANQISAYFVRSRDVIKGRQSYSGPPSRDPIRLSGPLGVDITTLRELEGKAWQGGKEAEY